MAKAKNSCGWGLKDLNLFGCALDSKCLWRCLFDNGLLGRTIQSKYLSLCSIVDWCRIEPKSRSGVSCLETFTAYLPYDRELAGLEGW